MNRRAHQAGASAPAIARAAAAAIALALASCGGGPPETVLARVGDSTLTMEEAALVVDTTTPDAQVRLKRFIDDWVAEELIYQEALHAGIETRGDYRAFARSAGRQVANQILLDSLVYSRIEEFPESMIAEYLYLHPEEFSVSEDHVKLSGVNFSSRQRARSFASGLARRLPWSAAVDSAMGDTAWHAVTRFDSAWFTQTTLHDAVWKVARTLENGETSFPVATPDGHTVVRRLVFVPKGNTVEPELVRADVIERLRLEEGRRRYGELLGTLRGKYTVQILR